MKKIIKNVLQRIIIKIFGPPKQNIYNYIAESRGALKGRTVLITGGSGAIGTAISLRLSMEGAFVGVCGRDADKTQNVVAMIERNGGKATPVILDLDDVNSVETAVERFVEKYGKIHILINNAGGSTRQKSEFFENQSFEMITNIINTNLVGTMRITQVVLKNMVHSKEGRIINISSTVALRGREKMVDYAVAKGGIISFTKCLAIELGQFGITVNAVSPGQINRDIYAEQTYSNVSCLGYKGHVTDIANMVCYLATDYGSYITGQNIIVDGGRTLGLWGESSGRSC